MPPPAPPRPNPPDGDGRVDLDTARRMVAEAVVRATAGDDKTTAIVAARVQEAGRRAARHNRMLKAGLVVTFVATIAAAARMWESHRAASALANDVGIDRGPAKRPSGDIPTRVYTGREIYEQNRAAVYVIGFLSGNKVGGVCTGVRDPADADRDQRALRRRLQGQGRTPIVTQNDSGGHVRFHILGGQMHPRYKPGQHLGRLARRGPHPRRRAHAEDRDPRERRRAALASAPATTCSCSASPGA